jgi:pyruvate dehydrogenase kinase 2/3/4
MKVSDEGGGIRRSHMKKIWSYLFTTANTKDIDNFVINDDTADFSRFSPLAGLGVGLPIARCYARHLGGDLVVMSMEGYGTDSFVYLARVE